MRTGLVKVFLNWSLKSVLEWKAMLPIFVSKSVFIRDESDDQQATAFTYIFT